MHGLLRGARAQLARPILKPILEVSDSTCFTRGMSESTTPRATREDLAFSAHESRLSELAATGDHHGYVSEQRFGMLTDRMLELLESTARRDLEQSHAIAPRDEEHAYKLLELAESCSERLEAIALERERREDAAYDRQSGAGPLYGPGAELEAHPMYRVQRALELADARQDGRA